MANLTPLFLNNVSSTVQAGSSAIGSSSATGVNVATGDGANFGTIGTNQFIPAVIVDTATSPETVKEYVWITARSTDALTVVRQAEESSRYAASTTTIAAGYTIAAVATATQVQFLSSALWTPRHHNFLAMNGDPGNFWSSAFALTSGIVRLTRINIPAAVTVNHIVMQVMTAGSGLTAGQNFAGIYDASGNRLAVTGDQSTAWASTGVLSMSLTAPVTIGGPADGYVFVAVLPVGTTPPKFLGVNDGSASVALVNINLTAAQSRTATHSASGQTSLPTTVTFVQDNSSVLPLFAALT